MLLSVAQDLSSPRKTARPASCGPSQSMTAVYDQLEERIGCWSRPQSRIGPPPGLVRKNIGHGLRSLDWAFRRPPGIPPPLSPVRAMSHPATVAACLLAHPARRNKIANRDCDNTRDTISANAHKNELFAATYCLPCHNISALSVYNGRTMRIGFDKDAAAIVGMSAARLKAGSRRGSLEKCDQQVGRSIRLAGTIQSRASHLCEVPFLKSAPFLQPTSCPRWAKWYRT